MGSNQPARIRVLIVDDSVFMRTMLKNAVAKSPRMDVVGSAQNGQEALQKIKELKPDVVTLDIEMPGVDGIEVLKRVMAEQPLPIVMVSTKTQDGAALTFKALELGAVDYVAKPLADKEASLQSFQEKVVRAVETAFEANRSRIGLQDKQKVLRPRKTAIQTDGVVVAIGISAGGPATLHKLVPMIPKEFPPIVLAQHMPADFTGPFAKRLDGVSEIEVKEAANGDLL
ncbi:MAG: response regulator, partial [Planctomycetota bacterium]